MCRYDYVKYRCGHDYYLVDGSIEICEGKTLSAYSVDVWTPDMCANQVVTCIGIDDESCDDCQATDDFDECPRDWDESIDQEVESLEPSPVAS